MRTPLYYASGSNRPADIRGFAAIGHAIGVAAPELSANAEAELARLAGSKVQVFVDSGAFSEVKFEVAGPRVVAPITAEDWTERLALYRRLAEALGAQLSVVAPDRIGDQEHTFALLRTYAAELRAIRALGTRILVPIQKGTRTQAAFVVDVESALGFADFVHAIPSRKKATTLDELRNYLAAVRPSQIHFLGLGIRNPNAPAVLELLETYVPEVAASFDSNMIRANAVRGLAPRKLTRARDEASRLIAAGAPFASAQELGIILAFGSEAEAAAVRAIATTLPQARAIVRQLPLFSSAA